MKLQYLFLGVLITFLTTLILPFPLIYIIPVAFSIIMGSYLLTFLDQQFLFDFLNKHYFKIMKYINKIFGTNFHSTTMRGVDENYLPYCNFGYRHGEYIGKKRNPLQIAARLDDYIEEGNEEGIESTSEWIMNNYTEKDDFIIWRMDYRRPQYDLDKGWISGMYQARILKALYKLYELKGDEKYKETVMKGFNAFEEDFENGGLKIEGDEGWWFPEYGQKGKEPAYVLNGMLYALFDLNYLCERTGNKRVKKIFDRGVKEVFDKINEYDKGSWTYYDRIGNEARFSYHTTHIDQMEKMYEITGRKKFKEYADKWNSWKYMINYPDGRFYFLNTFILNFFVFILYSMRMFL